MKRLLFGLAVAWSSVAGAQEQVSVAPDPGRDKAPAHAAPWCSGIKSANEYHADSVRRGIESGLKYWNGLMQPARDLCNAKPDDAVANQQVQAIEQAWINITGLSEAQALKTFKARLAADKLKADKEKLCDALSISEEVEGEERAFMTARRVLFGCVQKGWADKQPIWADSGEHVPDDLVCFVDASSVEPDPLVRLALVVDHLRFVWGAHKASTSTRRWSRPTFPIRSTTRRSRCRRR